MNEQFYLQPSITAVLDPDGIIVSRNALPATSESYDRACEILASDSHIDIDLATVILREDCLNNFHKEWCVFMHVACAWACLSAEETSSLHIP